MENKEKPVTRSERELLDNHFQRAALPPHLFTKITQIMKDDGHIRTPKSLLNLSPGGLLTAFVLTAGLLCLGFMAGKWQEAPAPVANAAGNAKFILLVHNDDQPAEDPMQQVKEYGDWLRKIRAERIADGEHLHSNGWLLAQNQVESKSEFPGRSEIGGYFTFEAADAEEALKIAKTCPHLHYNGTLELRQIH